MSAPEHFDAMERVRELLCGRDPLPQNYLVAVGGEQWFTQGSVTPPLGPQYAQTSTGLIVPMSVAREPAPIDQVKLYLTGEETLGAWVPLEQVLAALVQVPVELALPWVARWLSALRRPAASQTAVDVVFVDEHLLEPHRTRVRNILRDPGRVLVTPQALFCIAKLALLLCPSSGGPPPEEDVRPLVFALLGLADHLAADLDGLDEAEEIVIGDRPGPLGREVIANQLANSNRQETGRWTAFQRCWRELPSELAGHPRMVDLEAAYESATGVSLDDLVTVCGAAWASCANGNVMLAPDYFDGLGWAPERLERVLQLVSCDPASLSAEVRLEAEEFGIAWAIGTFERYPLVRWPSGPLTVIDPELTLDRGCGVWPLYDILRELGAVENRHRRVECVGPTTTSARPTRGRSWPASSVRCWGHASTTRTNCAQHSGASARPPTWRSTTATRGSCWTRPQQVCSGSPSPVPATKLSCRTSTRSWRKQGSWAPRFRHCGTLRVV